MQARLLLSGMKSRQDILLIRSKRIGDGTSHNSMMRRNGFRSYIKEKGLEVNLVDCVCDIVDKASCFRSLDEAFSRSKDIGGIVVFNSRAYMVAEYLKHKKLSGVRLVGYGLIEKNIAYLKEEYITYLLSEHPDVQGYSAVKAALEYLIYGKQGRVLNYTPVDILIKENVDYV